MLLETYFSILAETENMEKHIEIGLVESDMLESLKQFEVKAMVTKWKNEKAIFLIFEERTSVVQIALENKKEELTTQY